MIKIINFLKYHFIGKGYFPNRVIEFSATKKHRKSTQYVTIL